jgi:hypothetical protein
MSHSTVTAMLRSILLLAAALGPLCVLQGVQAAGRKLQATATEGVATTPGSIYYGEWCHHVSGMAVRTLCKS